MNKTIKIKIVGAVVLLIMAFNSNMVSAANINIKSGSTALVENTSSSLHFNNAGSSHQAAVQIDDLTGNFSGYAWSEDVGWINMSGVKVNSDKTVTGTANVENGSTLEFNSLPHNANVTINNSGVFSGYAWSEDVGWINFNNVTMSNDTFPLIAPTSAPRNLTLNLSNSIPAGQVGLSWTAPENNGGSAVTDYIIQYKISSESNWSTFNDGQSTNLSSTVTGLTANETYNFRVIAVNQAGNSNPSNIVTSLPSYISLTINNTNLSINVSPTSSQASSVSHSVTANSNYQDGISVYLSSQDNNANSRRLMKGSDYIDSLNSSVPTSLADNSWGFRLPNNVAVFGQNTDFNTKLFLPISLNNDKYLINKTTTAASSISTSVEYGVKINMSQPSGQYAQTVVYTVVSN